MAFVIVFGGFLVVFLVTAWISRGIARRRVDNPPAGALLAVPGRLMSAPQGRERLYEQRSGRFEVGAPGRLELWPDRVVFTAPRWRGSSEPFFEHPWAHVSTAAVTRRYRASWEETSRAQLHLHDGSRLDLVVLAPPGRLGEAFTRAGVRATPYEDSPQK